MKKLFQQVYATLIESKRHKMIQDFVKNNQIVFFILIIVAILIDSLFIKTTSDIVLFGTLLLYGIFANIIHMKSKATFLLCLGLLSVMFISFLLTKASVPTEKLTVWLYLLMILGILQQWRE